MPGNVGPGILTRAGAAATGGAATGADTRGSGCTLKPTAILALWPDAQAEPPLPDGAREALEPAQRAARPERSALRVQEPSRQEGHATRLQPYAGALSVPAKAQDAPQAHAAPQAPIRPRASAIPLEQAAQIQGSAGSMASLSQ
jgi:hypothetical protein